MGFETKVTHVGAIPTNKMTNVEAIPTNNLDLMLRLVNQEKIGAKPMILNRIR